MDKFWSRVNEMGWAASLASNLNPIRHGICFSVFQQVLKAPILALSYTPHLHRPILTLSFTPALAQFSFVSYDSEVSSYAHV